MMKSTMKKQRDPDSKILRALFCLAAAFSIHTILISTQALAVAAPAAGSFAYDIYDIAVNSILKGPIGFVGGLGAIVMGAVCAIQQKIMAAAPSILGGAALIKADAITTSLGALI